MTILFCVGIASSFSSAEKLEAMRSRVREGNFTSKAGWLERGE